MKKLKLFFLIFLSTLVYSQETDGTSFIKLDKKIVYVDNTPNTYFTMTVPGDSIKSIGVSNSFSIDGKIFQILKRDYSRIDYTNKSPVSKEIELLKKAMKFEVDYYENELFNNELDVKEEIFLNESGKRFHLWWFKIPEILTQGIEENDLENKTEYSYYLNWIANNFISVVSTYSYKGEDFENRIQEIKGIANSVRVFGAPIDIQGTSLKMETELENRILEFVNPKVNFTVDIPKWANIIETDLEQNWAVSFPDIDNVKNVADVSWYLKEDYRSLKKFNEHFILNLKMGDKLNNATILLKKELDMPENCNGIGYKIQLMRGKSLYDCQFVTFETNSHYILVKFVATPETYKVNDIKFEELIRNIRVSN